MTLRLFVLQAHYRKPLDFTAEALDAAATGWKGLNTALGLTAGSGSTPSTREALQAPDEVELSVELDETRERFIAAMDDDLNTSAALAVLFELAKPLRALANRLERGDAAADAELRTPQVQQRAALLGELAGVLGLRHENAAAPESNVTASGPTEAEIEAQIKRRQAAKAAKDFATADQIRALLLEAGIELIDKPGGVTDWIRR
jgi:cysteinyl-tRNA synthetase